MDDHYTSTYNDQPTRGDSEKRYDQQFHFHQITFTIKLLQWREFCFARLVYQIIPSFFFSDFMWECVCRRLCVTKRIIQLIILPVLSVPFSLSFSSSIFVVFVVSFDERVDNTYTDTHSIHKGKNVVFQHTTSWFFRFVSSDNNNNNKLTSYACTAVLKLSFAVCVNAHICPSLWW